MYNGQMKIKCRRIEGDVPLIDLLRSPGWRSRDDDQTRPRSRTADERGRDRGQPWLALRGQAMLKGDPFAPAIADDDIQALK